MIEIFDQRQFEGHIFSPQIFKTKKCIEPKKFYPRKSENIADT